MKLELGKTYINGNGAFDTIMRKSGYDYVGQSGLSYYPNGEAWNRTPQYNLIEDVIIPEPPRSIEERLENLENKIDTIINFFKEMK